MILSFESVYLYFRWWEEIQCSHLNDSQIPMRQFWCEHIIQRKPPRKKSMASVEDLFESTVILSLLRTAM